MASLKTTLDELAILGGPTAFDEEVFVGRPNLGNLNDLRRRIDSVLERKWLTNAGPLVRELQDKLAKLLDVKHCICMCNGTLALEIAIRAAGIHGEVIVPSFTFIATAHAVQWQQMTPVFCDIDPETHTIDPDQVERLITPRTTAIIGVHLWGRPCHVEELQKIADRHGLQLLFDAAHAFHCTHAGRMIGSFGNAEVLSFHATKFFNSLEGGAIATNDDDLARKVRLMKNFGFVDYDRVDHVGTNGKMNEFSAAVGLTSLDSVEEHIAINRRNYERYRENLAAIPGLKLIEYDPREICNYQYVVIEVFEEETGLSRDELVSILHAENVLARRYFYPGCHAMEPYRSFFPNAYLLLPNTISLASRVICLPTGTDMDPQGIDKVCGIVRLAIENHEEIRRRGTRIAGLHHPAYGYTDIDR